MSRLPAITETTLRRLYPKYSVLRIAEILDIPTQNVYRAIARYKLAGRPAYHKKLELVPPRQAVPLPNALPSITLAQLMSGR